MVARKGLIQIVMTIVTETLNVTRDAQSGEGEVELHVVGPRAQHEAPTGGQVLLLEKELNP